MRGSIVVAAYGPTGVTRRAVSRAVALAGPEGHVFVMAGLEPGRAAVAAIKDQRVTAVDGVGTAALREVLDLAGRGPVLFVHDDVLLTARCLAALTNEYEHGGGYVVPYSNDLGLDHFCGPLPESRRAARALDERSRTVPSEAVEASTVRPICVLASVADLRELSASHIVDPRLKLDVVTLDVRIAPGAVVAHDSGCTHRMLPAEGADSRPLLVAAMIVKDEEDMLPGCLESLDGLVDAVVVCDTGSSDRTVDIAESYGATVIHREWRDDFGWARSEALAAATDAWWVLTVDADDRVACGDPTSVRRMLSTYVGEYEAFGIVVSSGSAGAGSAFASPRIFRGGMHHYVGSVHEVLRNIETDSAPFAPRLDLVSIAHEGYSADVMTSKDKAQRNLSLTRSEFERDPNVKNAIEYARSIKLSGGDAAESYALLSDALERMRSDAGTVDTNRRAISYVLATMAIDKLELGEPAESAEHAREALELVPSDPVAARTFATACLKLGRPDLVVGMHEWRSAQKSVSPLFDSSSARATFASMLAVAALNLGRWRLAMDAVLESLRHEPDSPNDWVEMVTALAQMAPLADTAAFCRDLCDAGGTSPIAVEIGLMAALITSSDDAFRGLIGHAGALEGPMIEKICERAAVRGRPDLGEELNSAHVSSAVV